MNQIDLRWDQAVGLVEEITFDVPMREGYSWTGGGGNYPGCEGKAGPEVFSRRLRLYY